MVNASLNWASIVGIVLAVGGAGLYFMRSFKPALARDYDVFFAAIGLLCGGILFFQGWRLDPILQFGQFLLAGTTVFFAYESVRLRGIATDQARRSSYFDDEEPLPSRRPRNDGIGGSWDNSFDRFEDPQPVRRRFSSRNSEDANNQDIDPYTQRSISRAAIPEAAESRSDRRRISESNWSEDSERNRRMARFRRSDQDDSESASSFGQRRNIRQDERRGTRPAVNPRNNVNRKSELKQSPKSSIDLNKGRYASSARRSRPSNTNNTRINRSEDAAFGPSNVRGNSSQGLNRKSIERDNSRTNNSNQRNSDWNSKPSLNQRNSDWNSKPRDNSSRFDD